MTGGYLFLDYETNKENVKGKRFLNLEEDKEAKEIFERLIKNCVEETQSEAAKQVLLNWDNSIKRFKFHNPYNVNFILE